MPKPTSSRKDPYRSFNFLVEIEGLPLAGFMECSGLESETEVIEYREGIEFPNTVRKLPGLTRYSNISLKRGVSKSKDLYDWRNSVINGLILRKNVDIVLLDDSRQEVARWSFQECWPCRMSGPAFNALEGTIAIEELVICHEGFKRV
jgi:phage tail-like protein